MPRRRLFPTIPEEYYLEGEFQHTRMVHAPKLGWSPTKGYYVRKPKDDPNVVARSGSKRSFDADHPKDPPASIESRGSKAPSATRDIKPNRFTRLRQSITKCCQSPGNKEGETPLGEIRVERSHSSLSADDPAVVATAPVVISRDSKVASLSDIVSSSSSTHPPPAQRSASPSVSSTVPTPVKAKPKAKAKSPMPNSLSSSSSSASPPRAAAPVAVRNASSSEHIPDPGLMRRLSVKVALAKTPQGPPATAITQASVAPGAVSPHPVKAKPKPKAKSKTVAAPSVAAPSVGAPSVGAPSVAAPSVAAPSVAASNHVPKAKSKSSGPAADAAVAKPKLAFLGEINARRMPSMKVIAPVAKKTPGPPPATPPANASAPHAAPAADAAFPKPKLAFLGQINALRKV